MNMLQIHLNEWLGGGVDPNEFTLPQLLLRALIVFATMYLMVRNAGRRFMAQKNACDAVLASSPACLPGPSEVRLPFGRTLLSIS